MKRNRKATHIQWDVDELEDLELLPTEIDIPDDMTDMEEISDYITDQKRREAFEKEMEKA